MNYADYEYYINNYEGNLIPSKQFNKYAIIASQYIRANTYSNINENAEIIDEVKMCMCEIAENQYKDDLLTEDNTGISSEKVGDYSVSYESKENRLATIKNQNRNCLRLWLGNTGLLYRGVYK